MIVSTGGGPSALSRCSSTFRFRAIRLYNDVRIAVGLGMYRQPMAIAKSAAPTSLVLTCGVPEVGSCIRPAATGAFDG